MVERILDLNKEKTIFWSLMGILFLCLSFYMYFINQTVHNVVARQNMESEASQLALTIGSQEFAYITKKNNVTLELAYSMGFKDSSDKTFIAKRPSSQVSFLTR